MINCVLNWWIGYVMYVVRFGSLFLVKRNEKKIMEKLVNLKIWWGID